MRVDSLLRPGRAALPLGVFWLLLAAAWGVAWAAEQARDLLGADAAAYVQTLSDRQQQVAPAPTEGTSATNRVPGGTNLRANTLTSMDALDEKHRLGVGDQLSLRIIEDREPATELVVTDAGELDVPYLGRVNAKDRTCKVLALEIKELLEKEYYHRATVILAIDQFSRSRGRVYVVGQVRITGPLEIPSRETFTISKAILMAGGFTDFADARKVKLTRRGSGEVGPVALEVIDVEEILEKGRIEKDVALEPDDLVFVPARWLNI